MPKSWKLRYKDIASAKSLSILDPAAGSGSLLIPLIKKIRQINAKAALHVVGYEIDPAAAQELRAKLTRLYPELQLEVIEQNFLEAAAGAPQQFDLIIANPPYIRTQILGRDKVQELLKTFKLKGRVDLYYAFIMLCARFLKQDGAAGFITSNKYLTTASGKSLRAFMLHHYCLRQIIDLGDTKLFSAAVLPCIVIFTLGATVDPAAVRFTSVYQSKSETAPAQQVEEILPHLNSSGLYTLPDGRTFKIKQGSLSSVKDGGSWTLAAAEERRLLERISSNTFLKFADLGPIKVGIKTTADNVFIGSAKFGADCGLELLRPLITHRNAGQILPGSAPLWKVLYPHTVSGGRRCAVNLDDYPMSKQYLLRYYDQLSARQYLHKAKRQWYEIWVPQDPAAWAHRKIVFRDIAESPQFWLDDTKAVINGDCYWIDLSSQADSRLIYLALAVANSPFIEKFYDLKFNNKLYAGKRRYQAQYAAEFPLPDPSRTAAKKAIALVKDILAGRDEARLYLHKAELDHLVDELFLN